MADLDQLIRDPSSRLHYVGIAGSGMSALAQYRVLSGGIATGSDRSLDRGEQEAERECLEKLGIRIFPQDGSGIAEADVLVASTAVEDGIPDLVSGRSRGLSVIRRAELLAMHVQEESLAIAGSSGKSTVTAMVFEILQGAHRDPSLITGGRLLSLMDRGYLGNAFFGKGPMVVEADESDGTLVLHQPEVAVVLNLHRDHMETEKVFQQFQTFRMRTRGSFVVSDDPNLVALRDGSRVFGFGEEAGFRGKDLELGRGDVQFRVEGVNFHVPLAGRHNAENALAAAAVASAAGVSLEECAVALREYRGVHRRYEVVGEVGGVEIVDDFAHNPDKLRACLKQAQLRSDRVIAYYQPHGYKPVRFYGDRLLDMFAETLRPQDRLWLAPIYFAGGTVEKDVSSDGLVDTLALRGVNARLAGDRDVFVEGVRKEAESGDTVLVMGARDPTLSLFARSLPEHLS